MLRTLIRHSASRRSGRRQAAARSHPEILPEDVVVAAYPKSGNTWMQLILACVHYGIDPARSPDALVQRLCPDVHVTEEYVRYKPQMCFKSHHLPRPDYRRVIHLVRDGRDCLCSYKHYLTTMGSSVSFDDLVQGNVFPGSWRDHTQQWMENPHDAEILRVQYESLLADFAGSVGRISEFLGVSIDAAEIARIQQATSFHQMKQREQHQGWGHPVLAKSWPKDVGFVRRGQTGSHKDEMPADIASQFLHTSRPLLEDLGYEA